MYDYIRYKSKKNMFWYWTMSESQTNNTTNGWVNIRAKKKTYNIMFAHKRGIPINDIKDFPNYLII